MNTNENDEINNNISDQVEVKDVNRGSEKENDTSTTVKSNNEEKEVKINKIDQVAADLLNQLHLTATSSTFNATKKENKLLIPITEQDIELLRSSLLFINWSIKELNDFIKDGRVFLKKLK